MTLHNYRFRQVHETLNGVNPSCSFRDMHSAKSGPNLWQIYQVFGPWASLYGANGQMTMTVHNYRPRQFHRTSNGENPWSGYRDMGFAILAAARPPARTLTTIPLQPGGLRGKNEGHIWELSFNWCFCCCCCFMTIRPCLSCDMAIKIVDLKNSKSRACPATVKIDGYIWGLAFNWYVQFPFSVFRQFFFLI